MSGDRVIGVDVGGTKILAGLVDRAGSIVRTVEHETPTESEDAILTGIGSAIRLVLAGARPESAPADSGRANTPEGARFAAAALPLHIEPPVGGEPLAIGLGVPCNLDPVTGITHRATNLPLDDVDLGRWAREEFGLPVGVENDGNAAALAEWRLGAGRGARDLVMLTLGTGIGGGLILDGRLYRGWAELGHVVVDADGPPCQGSCHGRGHLEGVASGEAAGRAARELYGGDGDARVLVEQARAGDAAAVEALAGIGRLLGAAVGSFVNMFNPDVVVVGGGFGAAAGELVLAPARKAAQREAIQPADAGVTIVPAELGERAGLIGAALVGFDALDGVR